MEEKMKDFNVLRYRFLAMGISLAFILAGVVMFIACGFNLGIDFGSGYAAEFQIAPLGFSVSYSGPGQAELSVADGRLSLSIRTAEGIDALTLDPALLPLSGDLAAALEEKGCAVDMADPGLPSAGVVSGFGFPAVLSDAPVNVNFSSADGNVRIDDIRRALDGIDADVQMVGSEADCRFQIRTEILEGESQNEAAARITEPLEAAFAPGSVVMLSSAFVGSRFSSSLFADSIIALAIALSLILVYVSLRFRFAYAVSAITALVHDVLAMLSFVLIFRLEVSSTTVAAVLTIIGYSLNNTIVIFDRVRENIKQDRTADVDSVIAMSVMQSLTRTMITSLTTLFAIVPLALLGSGDIRLFAINLTWGIIAGGYSSMFLAPAFLHYAHRKMPINVFKEKKEEEYSLV